MSKWIVLLGVLASTFTASLGLAGPLYTSEMAPYIVQPAGRGDPEGVAVALVKALGSGMDGIAVETMPWTRLLERIKRDNEAVGFPVIRTASREEHYRWIVPLLADDIVLVSLSAENTQLKSRRSIGLLRGSVLYELVDGFDVDTIEWATDNMQAFLKMRAGRTQSWMTLRSIADSTIRAAGDIPEVYHYSNTLGRATLYLVSSPNYPEERVNQWRSALKKIRRDGSLNRLKANFEQLGSLKLAP